MGGYVYTEKRIEKLRNTKFTENTEYSNTN